MLKELAFTDPERWENGEFDWELKMYYKVPFSCFLGKPKKLFEAVQQLRASIASKDYIVPNEAMLLIEVQPFKGNLYLEIQKPEDYDASVVEIEKSKVYSTVYKGPFKSIKAAAKEFQQKVAEKKGLSPNSTYYWDFRHGKDLEGQRADSFVIFCRV